VESNYIKREDKRKMDEVRYMISEASKKVDVEAHVLRYWEDELELPIARNEMGHRYYKESDIELLKAVKQLKNQGFQLKAVKMLLPNLGKLDSLDSQTMVRLKDELNGKVIEMYGLEKNPENLDGTSLVAGEVKHEIKEQPGDKMSQFRAIMNHIILDALKENNTVLSNDISVNVTDGVIKEMSYLMRLQEEKEEERYKKFDSTLRDYQKSRMMAAATFEGKGRKKSKFFKKNKVYI
jgi:DNA-binding transcriptional MerR regulator